MTTKPPKLYGRVWSVKVSDGVQSYTWRLPIRFDASKTLDLNPNELKLSIIGLSQKSRSFLASEGLKITVTAGYTELSGEVFMGNIETVKDTREHGQFETQITAKDGAVYRRNLFVSMAIKEGTPTKQVIDQLLTKMISDGRIEVKGVEVLKKGAQKPAAVKVQEFDKKESERLAKENKPKEKLTKAQKAERKEQRKQKAQENRNKRRQKLVQQANAEQLKKDPEYIEVKVADGLIRGNAFDLLTELCAANNLRPIFLNGAIHIVPLGTAVSASSPLLDKTSGLIGIPDQTEKGWIFTSLMRSDIEIGQFVKCRWLDQEGLFMVRRIEYDADSEGQPWYMKIETLPANAV